MRQILLITPMVEERFHLAHALAALGHAHGPEPLGRLEAWSLPRLGLRLAVGGHGKTQFAVQTGHLLHQRPGVDLVVCAGAAGSLAAHVGVGDLVAATHTVEHDYTLRFARRPLPSFPGDAEALAQLAALSPDGWRLYAGPVASGDEDVIDGERARDIAGRTGALCVAWEGAGAARACRFAGVPFVELRAVTDAADKSAPVDFETNLALAMANLARLLERWLRAA
jgi:adenosylhomocysteine nucleosidase